MSSQESGIPQFSPVLHAMKYDEQKLMLKHSETQLGNQNGWRVFWPITQRATQISVWLLRWSIWLWSYKTIPEGRAFHSQEPLWCYKKKGYLGVLELRYERATLYIKEPLITSIQIHGSSLKFSVGKNTSNLIFFCDVATSFNLLASCRSETL